MEIVIKLCDGSKAHLRHGEEKDSSVGYDNLPNPAAPRGTPENPCWCNGPWKKENQHHSFCRKRRSAWHSFLTSLDVI